MKSGVVPPGRASVAVPPFAVPPVDWVPPHPLSASATANASTARPGRLGDRRIIGLPPSLLGPGARDAGTGHSTAGISRRGGECRRRRTTGQDLAPGFGQVGPELDRRGDPVTREQELGDPSVAWDERTEQV